MATSETWVDWFLLSGNISTPKLMSFDTVLEQLNETPFTI